MSTNCFWADSRSSALSLPSCLISWFTSADAAAGAVDGDAATACVEGCVDACVDGATSAFITLSDSDKTAAAAETATANLDRKFCINQLSVEASKEPMH
jgi:hypothetical protein